MAAASSSMLLLTHCRLMSKHGRCRSLRWNDFRSASDSTRPADIGASRLCLALLPGTSGLRLRMGRVLVEPDGEALGHPEPGAEHNSHGHPDLVAGRRHQRRGLLRGEVVGKFLGLARHGKDCFGGFPKLPLQNPVDRDTLVRRDSKAETGRLVTEIPGFRK